VASDGRWTRERAAHDGKEMRELCAPLDCLIWKPRLPGEIEGDWGRSQLGSGELKLSS